MKRNSFVVILALLAMLATASAVQAAPPSSPFSGEWIGTDPFDGSTEHLVVNGGDSPRVAYDDETFQACGTAGSTDFWLSTDLRGTVVGITMTGVFKSAKCGHVALSSWKGQSMVWMFNDNGTPGVAADDTLSDTVVIWRRV
jgi:hypothetical protein